jgi:7,8-dihydropterin-6-yl-methyl-4-(beta-D-ribofuranosyl)aminobenzene 5'-phosphate synthase
MKITIVYDNTLYEHGGLVADWGFSALVEVPPEKKILFDTGTNGDILLNNMAVLGIDPSYIDEIFISHAHHDHVGGLTDFLPKNNHVKLWIPPSFSSFHQVKEPVVVSEPREMSDGVYSTGELEGIEQSMVVNTKKGLVVIVGCSHPRMDNILGTASQFGDLYGIVGGLHSAKPKSLRGLSLICATHCTQQKSSIHALYQNAYQEGGVGRIFEIP